MSPLHFSGDKAMAANASPPEWGTQETAAWRPPVGPPATIAGGIIVENVLIDRAIRELYQPNPAQTLVPRGRKAELYDIAARTIGDCPITYLEFGVHKGWSMQHMSTRFTHPDATFVGFDSFEGLPEAWGPLMPGHFSTDGATPPTADSRIRFVKGWFQNSVPGFLRASKSNGPVLIHFDADLYSSTLFLMTTLWHYIPDYYFLFDEFTPLEVVAMYDFARGYPVAFEFTACTVDERDRPLQIFGRLRNADYQPTLPR